MFIHVYNVNKQEFFFQIFTSIPHLTLQQSPFEQFLDPWHPSTSRSKQLQITRPIHQGHTTRHVPYGIEISATIVEVCMIVWSRFPLPSSKYV